MVILGEVDRNRRIGMLSTEHPPEARLFQTTVLHERTVLLQQAFGKSDDLIVKGFPLGADLRSAICYIDGMIDTKHIQSAVMEPLNMLLLRNELKNLNSTADTIAYLTERVLTAGDIGIVRTGAALMEQLLSGSVILFVDGISDAIRIASPGWENRSVTEPTSQSVVRGPMEAFTENIRTNTTLLRRRIRNSRLWLETRQIGRLTQTSVTLAYINGLASEEAVAEIRKRLDLINIDGILEGGYVEEFIQSRTYSPFPTVYNSERPDTIAAGLLEGRIAILVDGTPFVMLVPALLVHFFQSPEDYAQKADIGSLLRMLRYLSFFIAMLAPSFYIAVTTFHQEMLPTNLLINLASQREGVPFPAFVEAVLMELTYEILREAGIRMPRNVGQAVSIVGTLVIGQAAVEAGIVSAVMVIIVSITAISSYVIPASNLNITVRLIRFALMGLAASFGFFGILMGLTALTVHVCGLRSIGVPYTTPLAPFIPEDQKDTLFRISWPKMLSRPRLPGVDNRTRQKTPKSSGGGR